jgi:hypothetical protein
MERVLPGSEGSRDAAGTATGEELYGDPPRSQRHGTLDVVSGHPGRNGYQELVGTYEYLSRLKDQKAALKKIVS